MITVIAVPVLAQQTAPVERVTFQEAIERALKNNPSIQQASEAVLRAEGLLQQARAATLPAFNAFYTNATLSTGTSFNGIVVQPRNQSTMSASLSMPVLAASQWAAANQARDQIEIANFSTADVRKQIAVATAQTYLAVINQERQVQVTLQARDAANAHLDYATRRLQEGAGTRLNQLRAAQEVTTDEARLENARLGVSRAQEALGVLLAANGPVDANGEPTFDVPAGPVVPDESAWVTARTDLRLQQATQRALERVWHDSSKDWIPTATAAFNPQALEPSGAFTNPRSWRFALTATIPVFDSGQRRGLSRVREAAALSARDLFTSLQNQARSEVRVAQAAVASNERALASARLAAQQAEEVLSITTTAFEAGAVTNLEVIDAQRSARDAETAAVIAEDAVRRSRLDLLTALGRFPNP